MTANTAKPVTDNKPVGLTTKEVAARHEAGQSNHIDTRTSRSVKSILRANLFTIFNAILVTATISVLAVGDWRDAVFGFVLVINLAIGIISELRSKRTLDSLAVLQAPTTLVLRDGKKQKIPSEELVIDDIIEMRLGDQVPADGAILTSAGLEIDESALTGESKPVSKKPGDPILSGTAVVGGSGQAVVEVIGAESWAQKITTEAKKFSKVNSEIQNAINTILKWITIILPFVIVVLLWSQLRADEGDWRDAVVLTVAGVVGMIPQGLVLLTSMNFGLAAANLARKGVLVQELPAVEILARVDVLCLDKTGTLTTGEIRGRELVQNPHGDGERQVSKQFSSLSVDQLERAVLYALTADDTNATATAVMTLVVDDQREVTGAAQLVPFNSIRKWSALTFPASAGLPDEFSTWVFGAPEVVLDLDDPAFAWAAEAIEKASAAGRRSVCLTHSADQIVDDQLPGNRIPAIVAVLEEDVRADAHETLEYFREQGVTIKIISGDAPKTVGVIATEIGLKSNGGDGPVVLDARTLPEIGTEEFADVAQKTDVFGRVTPEQKRGLVKALQSRGSTVAMTGDGVNDALALKDADLGIAMGNGASATKAVSRLVLVDSEFSVLPGVVADGRRIIANMERVSSLFLSKTTYAMLLAVIVAVFGLAYPFLPRHLTYIGALTIGVPAFFLSLAPNTRLYRPGFLRRTLLIAIPSGTIFAFAALASYLEAGQSTLDGHTAATITLIIGAVALLVLLARPWNFWRVSLVATMAAGAFLGLIIPVVREFFALTMPSGPLWIVILVNGGIAATLVVVSYMITSRWRSEGREPGDLEAIRKTG